AVGRSLGDDLRADDGVGAGLGVDQHLLAELRGQTVSDDAHQGVDGAARIERHDDADGLDRPAAALRPAHRREERRSECRRDDTAPSYRISRHCFVFSLPAAGLYSGWQPIHRVWTMTDKPQVRIRRLMPAD